MHREIFALYIVGVNMLAFLIYGIDKRKAIKRRFRIPEALLLLAALAGGALGAFAGMHAFRHKTRKAVFAVGVPLLLVIQLGLLFYFMGVHVPMGEV